MWWRKRRFKGAPGFRGGRCAASSTGARAASETVPDIGPWSLPPGAVPRTPTGSWLRQGLGRSKIGPWSRFSAPRHTRVPLIRSSCGSAGSGAKIRCVAPDAGCRRRDGRLAPCKSESSWRIAAVLTIGLTATAKATIPNSQTGVYTGCYLPNQGNVLRLIDFQLTGGNDCDGKLVGWNSAGPKGATGAQGPAGPKGATGPQGPAGPSFARGHFRTGEKFVGTSYETLATVDMPAGMYVLSGKASTYQHEILGTDWWAMVSCRLLQKSRRRRRDRAGHVAHRGQRRLQRARVAQPDGARLRPRGPDRQAAPAVQGRRRRRRRDERPSTTSR